MLEVCSDMEYSYVAYSEVGERKNNEDAFLATKSDLGWLFAVADGLGGYTKGEIASQIAVNILKDEFSKETSFNLIDAIDKANHCVIENQKILKCKMKTTISVVWIGEKTTQIAYVGDSRIYAFDRRKIIYQSLDHSMAQIAVREGKLSNKKIRWHKDRNILTKVLGVEIGQQIPLYELANNEYERIILCTDGFWECITEKEMCRAIKRKQSPEMWLEKMKKKLQKCISENQDNNTAIVIIRKGEK